MVRGVGTKNRADAKVCKNVIKQPGQKYGQ